MSRKQTPSDFLKQIIGRPVVVKLNNGVDYRGKRDSLHFLHHNFTTCFSKITTFKLRKNINLLTIFYDEESQSFSRLFVTYGSPFLLLHLSLARFISFQHELNPPTN